MFCAVAVLLGTVQPWRCGVVSGCGNVRFLVAMARKSKVKLGWSAVGRGNGSVRLCNAEVRYNKLLMGFA